MEKNEKLMKVYILIWVDIDDDCPKKSEIEVVGVFDSMDKAEEARSKVDNRIGYSDDDRCYYHFISEVNTIN